VLISLRRKIGVLNYFIINIHNFIFFVKVSKRDMKIENIQTHYKNKTKNIKELKYERGGVRKSNNFF